ncbi:hypothetical protein B0H67DRAFT_320699 [Lasiosphaeris hirsuta]|uniref:Uncharacterized protein n=1 Tax=Lasiosphaeris hirsuta TaxID=260670 RepID=A0AA40DL53_9PEZI|nr:hypothetical protein B0H67DRAFT_320699 [Lasiosphaeris hirsuta]
MSHLTVSPPDRPDSRVSLAPSNTTYHSFNIDPFQAETGPETGSSKTVHPPTSGVSKSHEHPGTQEMRRQDSGYESVDVRDSESHQRRTSTASVTSSTKRQRTRPPTHRSSRSGPVSYLPRNGRRSISPHRAYQRQSMPQQPVKFFHFPHFAASDPALDETEMSTHNPGAPGYAPVSNCPPNPEVSAYPMPPQTTHYWTSDRTRRLEYAAIDAASRGVRGWVMRYVVPDCFVPKNKRRVGFEDDRGSVVRYRLELDEGDDGVEKNCNGKRRKGWWFSMQGNHQRRSST